VAAGVASAFAPALRRRRGCAGGERRLAADLAYWRVFWWEESLAEAATACTVGSAAAFCRVSNMREIATTATTDPTINPNVNSGPVTGLRRLAFMTSSND
jgi:hypothetical protein